MARNFNENNLAGIENLDFYDYMAEFIPLASSEESFTRSEEIYQFIEHYFSLNSETLQINNDKKCGEKSPCLLNRFYKCHHDRRYGKTFVS